MGIVFIIERLVVVEALIRDPDVSTFGTRVEAYRHLCHHLREHRVNTVDLLQFSGHTALPLIRELAETSPRASVRLLLYHPTGANAFDSDNNPNHAHRISTTVEEIALIEKEYKRESFHVEIYYYQTPPALSSVLVDKTLLSIGWYHCFLDPDSHVLRLRGHDAAAINAHGDAAFPLATFVQRQFELRLLAAEHNVSHV